ncbi:hypothetical protein MHU86_21870 [Fragilaria crotonensis]|nr:hypothetical protein MHU86_21870 [Fragilaria crotonensis]
MNVDAKRTTAILSLIFIVICLVLGIKVASDSEASSRRLSGVDRPVIYTFYSPLVRALDTPREQKIQKADQELLVVWKAAWYEAGWDARIISLEEAKQYRGYSSYLTSLQQTKLLGHAGRNHEYNEYCFLRYLAMAFVGGGTMADYDLFPLSDAGSSPAIPTPTRFTVYQKTLNKAGPVPALCSGLSSEWERIAQEILEISQEPSASGWSDMTALMQLYKKQPDSMTLLDQVLGSNEVEQSPSAHERCRLASRKNAWGVHFSHYDVLQSGHKVFERPQIASDFLENWRRQCIESGES